jgi:hypothetical protein
LALRCPGWGPTSAALQDAYIAQHHMVVVDGYIGSDPSFRTSARLIMDPVRA